MSLVDAANLSLTLGSKPLFEDLSFRLAPGDRLGVVGPNGSGKSSLLRLIAGELDVDGGQLVRAKGMRLAYLRQDLAVETAATLRDYVVEQAPGLAQLQVELTEAEAELQRLANSPEMDAEAVTAQGMRVGELHHQLGEFESDFAVHQAERILTGLGFTTAQFDQSAGQLSGGWRMRAALAGLLFQRPDLLLLDEPTNHLDLPSVAWLQGFLQTQQNALVLISHDRDFLNAQINRVLSFEPWGMVQHRGNYDSYWRKRDELAAHREREQERLAQERERQQRFIDKFRAQASKAKQVQSRMKALAKMPQVQTLAMRKGPRFQFPDCTLSGREVLRGTDLCKRYDSHEVLRAVDVRLERGQRVALLGPNGAGKTTLLRLLAGELQSDGGAVQRGHQVHLGYFAQHHADDLDLSSTALSEVGAVSRSGGVTQVRAALGSLGLGDLEVDKPIRFLSGGERARVALAKLLVQPSNCLLLDEPTNHLDLAASESLAQALGRFKGTLLFVSHNLALIRALAQQVWHVEDGQVLVYPGGFDDFLRRYDSNDKEAVGLRRANTPAATPKKGQKKAAVRSDRRSKRAPSPSHPTLQRELRQLEMRIAALEAQQKADSEALCDPVVYAQHDRRQALLQSTATVAKELEDAMQRWTQLQEQLETPGARSQ